MTTGGRLQASVHLGPVGEARIGGYTLRVDGRTATVTVPACRQLTVVTLMMDEALAIEPIPMDGFLNDHAATGRRPAKAREPTRRPTDGVVTRRSHSYTGAAG